jgi:hypothetical protein
MTGTTAPEYAISVRQDEQGVWEVADAAPLSSDDLFLLATVLKSGVNTVGVGSPCRFRGKAFWTDVYVSLDEPELGWVKGSSIPELIKPLEE